MVYDTNVRVAFMSKKEIDLLIVSSKIVCLAIYAHYENPTTTLKLVFQTQAKRKEQEKGTTKGRKDYTPFAPSKIFTPNFHT